MILTMILAKFLRGCSNAQSGKSDEKSLTQRFSPNRLTKKVVSRHSAPRYRPETTVHAVLSCCYEPVSSRPGKTILPATTNESVQQPIFIDSRSSSAVQRQIDSSHVRTEYKHLTRGERQNATRKLSRGKFSRVEGFYFGHCYAIVRIDMSRLAGRGCSRSKIQRIQALLSDYTCCASPTAPRIASDNSSETSCRAEM